MKTKITDLVVFDGTSAYVIPVSDLQNEIEENEVDVLGKFTSFDLASDYCDMINENEL